LPEQSPPRDVIFSSLLEDLVEALLAEWGPRRGI